MQTPSALGTCGGGHFGGGGTFTHLPSTIVVPSGQTHSPAAFMTSGGTQVSGFTGLQSRTFSTLTVVVGELIVTGFGETFVVHTGVVLGGHTFGNGKVPSATVQVLVYGILFSVCEPLSGRLKESLRLDGAVQLTDIGYVVEPGIGFGAWFSTVFFTMSAPVLSLHR
jgi:hypothetical protein